MAAQVPRYKHNRLQQLRGFCYAARAQSISKGAEKMDLSQPSVSLQIKALEKELDVQLFHRRGPRLTLTPDGKTLLQLAQPLVDGLDKLVDTFAKYRDSADVGTVNIAAGGSTLQYILPPYVEKFTRTYPKVDVRFHNVTGKTGLALLRAGDVDFAVGPLLEKPPDINFAPLSSYEPMLITCHDHPLSQRPRITLKDISRYPLIMPPKDQTTYQFVEAVFLKHSLDYDVKLEVGGYEVIKKYVQFGLGISIVMNHCLGPEDSLFRVSVRRYFPKRTYGVVLLRNQRISAAARRFVATICPDVSLG